MNVWFPYPGKRVVRIKTKNVGEVTTAVPDAKPIAYYPDGTADVDVDWTLDNMTALSNAGQPALSTIFDGYTFPGSDRPFYHQLRIAEFLTRNPRAYCFSGMGTGKTRSACWAADYLMVQGRVRKVLIVCMKSLMYSAWAADIHKTCIHRTWTVLYGERKQREKMALTRDTDFDIINFDGVEIIGEILKNKKYDLIIIDESTKIKNPSTRLWKAIANLVRPETRVWALTGTPTPQGPMDAFGQAKMVTPDRLPKTKTAFQSMVQFKVANFIFKNKPGWQDTVREIMQPAIYIKKSDCLDLPPLTRVFVDVELSTAQKQSIAALATTMTAQYEDDYSVECANAGVLHMKLRQVYSGAVYANDGATLLLDNTNRIRETIDLIHRAKAEGDDSAANGKPHSKALVFIPFRSALAAVSEALSEHFDVAVISGDTSVHERRRILDQFQNTPQIDVIVAIPDAFSHGVTATAASLIIWFTPPSGTEVYLQACERTDRPGQTQHQTIVHLQGEKREHDMYQVLLGNKSEQETLLDMYYDFVKKGK